MREIVYITGGSGFIGKHLSISLIEYYDVYIIDKWIDFPFFSKYPDIKSITVNLVNDPVPENLPAPAYIINLASSLVTANRELNNYSLLLSENVQIILNLYKRFAGNSTLKLFMQFGSAEEYGNIPAPFAEHQKEKPNSHYALMKHTITNLVLFLQTNHQFPATVIRPGNLFGKFQHESRFIPYVFKQLYFNNQLDVTFCEQKRDFIYIQDFINIIQKILKKYAVFVGEIVNVSSGESVRLKDVIQNMKVSIQSNAIVNYGALPYRENEAMDLNCNIDKLQILLREKIHFDLFERLNEYTQLMISDYESQT